MISLVQYYSPKEEIKDAVHKFGLLYQLLNQDKVETWTKKNKSNFSGTMSELSGLLEIDDFMTIKESDKWFTLLTAKFLLDKFNPDFDISKLSKLDDSEVLFVGKTVKEGFESKKILEEWLKPLLEDEACIQAIEDACMVAINKAFRILKISNLEESKVKEFTVYPYVLEIQSAEEMLTFLKLQKEVRNCLIVTLQRNKEYGWKSEFYLFLVYKGTLYSIDNSEGRLNLSNTEGCRNPDRYLERKYDKVWLPVDLLESKESKSKELMVKGAKVYKITSLEDIAKDTPGIIYWLYAFVDRVISYVEEQEVPKGVTTAELPKLLTYANKSDFKIEDSGAGSYLEEIYASDCKDIVVQEKHLPKLVGTEEYVRNVIAYRKRELIAESLQKTVEKDYKKNSKKVYEEIRKFVRGWPIEDLLRRSLADKGYSYMQYRQFGFQEKEDGLQKEKLVRFGDGGRWFWDEGENVINISSNLYVDRNCSKRSECICCKKVRWKQMVILDFIDWRQFVEFFGITEKDIPIQMKQHLHQQLEMYVGNPILDDTDPVDELKDPWFREKENRMGGPLLRICIPVCNRCLKRLGYVNKEDKCSNTK